MAKKNRKTLGAAQYIDATLAMIAECGSSHCVNLREVSRRLGCAHTNVYNYFTDLKDLLWKAFGRALVLYGTYISKDLERADSDHDVLVSLLSGLATFPLENPGLYRFIGSDPFAVEEVPPDIMTYVVTMKKWMIDVVHTATAGTIERKEADRISNILLAYIDGEVFNTINGRVTPGDNVPGRIVGNAMQILTCFVSGAPSKTDTYISSTSKQTYKEFPNG